MLTARARKELPALADNLARGMAIVKYKAVLYLPVDYESLQPSAGLDPERRVWIPLNSDQVIALANREQGILFTNDGESRGFVGMVRQIAEEQEPEPNRLLIKTVDGVKELREDGLLHDREQGFCPHFITAMLNDDPDAKKELYALFVEWLGEEEDATSLLHHLAAALAPGWPAVRYVLLIGDGRNGKSLIMKMLVDLFGKNNTSHVTRQDMAAKSTACHDLTNGLLNVVFDGEATYLKDSGLEKTLTAGEVGSIKKLYDTLPTDIQTNGLFIEGLNREPKSSDKSSALQKRIVRFHLPNVYELNHAFEKRLRSPEMLGAFLALLIDHYVKEDEVAVKLAPVRSAIAMKLEHARVNNIAIQFLEYVETSDPLGASSLVHRDMHEVAQQFKSWRVRECDDISPWAIPDVETLLRPLFISERRSKRVNGKVMKVRTITGFRYEAIEFLDYVRGEEEITDDDTLVDERAVLDVESAATAG